MNVHVFPTRQLKGSVELPASKSYSVRAFMVAACGGSSRIISPSLCDDALAAVAAAKKLGARIRCQGKVWDVKAGAGREDLRCINVKESGTVLRMLLPLVALKNKPAKVIGEGTLKGRPNHHLVQTLQRLGIDVKGTGAGHSVPISFGGGIFRGGNITIDGSLSSQFISALLMACPQIAKDSTINVSGKKVVSTDYITMTLKVLQKAGVRVDRRNLRTYHIKSGQGYQGLRSFHVPSDYGLAAFLLAAGALVSSNIMLNGCLDDNFVQADAHIILILKKMGVVFKKTSRSIQMKGPFCLKGGTFSLKDCPDLLPILSVLALFSSRPVKFTNIAHVRVKESDRISDLRKELIKVGGCVTEGKDFMIVHPLKDTDCKHGMLLDPHRDHRLAMAFCVLGLRLGVKVKDIECVTKSYPGFLRDLRMLGGRFKKY